MFFNLFRKRKEFILYEIDREKVSSSEIDTISKECKKAQNGEYFFDVFLEKDKQFILISKFKLKTFRDKKIAEMFVLLTYAYSKKRDIKLFQELIFKEKINTNYKKIILKFDDKARQQERDYESN